MAHSHDYRATYGGKLYDTFGESLPYVSTIVDCPACKDDECWRTIGYCGDGCCAYTEQCGFCEGEGEVEHSKALTHDADTSYWPSDQ